MLFLFATAAIAQTCPDISEQVDQAWAAFDDAELALAEERLGEAAQALPCQERTVTTDEIKGLYRLWSLVDLAQEDKQGAVYATIRLVTIDPSDKPGPELGPQLAEMHDTWSQRLGQSYVRLQLRGEGEAWVDGRPLSADTPLEVVAGEHLLQGQGPDGWHGRVVELAVDTDVVLDDGLELVEVPSEAAPEPDPIEPPSPPRDGPSGRRVALVTAGGASMALGAGALGLGWSQHQRFRNDDYLSETYGDCARGDTCYDGARAKEIRSDATTIRALYLTGYVLSAAGVGLLGAELFVLPQPSRGGGTVGLRVDW